MVWNTTQSALYKAECCRDKRAPRAVRSERAKERCAKERRAGERHADVPKQCAPQKKRKSLFDDGDTLLLLVLLYILVREKSDQTLILSLLIALLM